ncbi:MAG TPA: S9 family peptidase [Patescibacteria group bacterium]|nr:S9 family peptidase [Patescibacteria group bacterium]
MTLGLAAIAFLGASRARAAAAGGPAPAPGGTGQTALTLERVARFPPPGNRVPTGFRFTHDGRILYYLALDGDADVRMLVREEVKTGRREVVARAEDPGRAPSREEVLRRERLRLQDRGITQFVLAAKTDRVVYVWAGDLYLARPGGEPIRLTRSEAPEQDPQLSADGRRLAFVRDGELYVLDVETLEERRLTSGARDGVTNGLAEYIAQEEMDRRSGFWWSPDGSRIAYAQVDETGIPIYPIVHQGGDTWDVETHRYPFAGGPNARVRLGIVSSAGGDTTWLDLAPAGEDVYLARARFGTDGALYVQVESRDQKTLRLLRFAASGGPATQMLEERSETWINLGDDFHPLEKGGFLWSSERSGWKHLELRGADGGLVRTLTSGPWAVDRLEGVDEKRGLVYFTAGRETPLEKSLYRVPLGGGETERITPQAGFHAVVASPEGSHFVDAFDSVRTPPVVTLCSAGGKTIRTLEANDDPEIAALGLPAPELVSLHGPDGTLLYGAIFKPPDLPPGRRCPALVRVYGGPTAQTVKNSWELTQDLRAQYLARQGYVVFRLDNRGTPRRGRAFESALYHRLGSVEVEDQIAGARWLASLPYVDGGRIGIYGWSYGGYMAALAVLKAPELFRAAVAGAPVTGWDGYDTHYTERYMGTPEGNPSGYRAASVLTLAATLQNPLLIIHGMSDENVHFRHTARLLNVLNAAHRPYDLLVFPDERHLPRALSDRVYMEERLLRHFDRALKNP